MRAMIIDIDDSDSLFAAVRRLSEGWFDPQGMYENLKANGKTNSPDFWRITTRMLADVSEYLGWTPDQFLNEWDQRCIQNDTMIMGYHCTRHSDRSVFTEKGILPFSEETIRLSKDKSQTLWEYRFQRSPGPWFLLSYRYAKNSGFCIKGPEILLARNGYHIGVDPAKSVPLIIHCVIPYSILSGKDYLAFCILRAYFNFLDPDDDLTFDGYSLDLNGKSLAPQYIVRTEER